MAVVVVNLEVDASGTASIKGVAGQLKDLGAQGKTAAGGLQSVFQGIGQGVGQSLFNTLKGIPAGLGEAAKAAMDYGGKLVDLEAQTGVAVEAQQELDHAAQLVGLTFEKDVAPALAKMQKALIDTPEKFMRLGMSVRDLRAMKPEEQFEAIAAKIAEIQDPAERSAAAMEIFGKSGTTLLPLLSSNIKAAREEAVALGLVMSSDVAHAADDLGDSIDTLSAVWDGLIRNFGAAIVTSEPLHVLIEGLSQIIGTLSKDVGGGQSAMRAFVDGGVLIVAQGLGLLVSVIGGVIDVWSALQIGVIALGGAFEKAAVGIGIWRDVLNGTLSPMKAVEEMHRRQAEVVERTNREIQAEITTNTERQNKLAIVGAAVEKLTTAIRAADGVTHKSTETIGRQNGALGESAGALKKAADARKQYTLDVQAEFDRLLKFEEEDQKRIDENTKQFIEDVKERIAAVREEADAHTAAHEQMAKDGEDFMKSWAEETQRRHDAFMTTMDDLRGLGDAIADLGDVTGSGFLSGLGRGVSMFAAFAAEAKNAKTTIEKVTVAIQALTAAYNVGYQTKSKAQGALSGAAAGAGAGFGIAGPWGAVVGGVIGAGAGIAGAAKGQKEELQQLRAQYNELVLAAEKAGVAFKIALDPKNPQQYRDAILEINRALDTQAEAQEKLKEAVEEYGFTVDELGSAYAGLFLEDRAAKLYEQWNILNAAGVDHAAILARVGPEVGKLVDQYVAAGAEIPQAMKPIIDDLYKNGKLVHENGEAYTDAEYKGLSYTQTMSQMFKDLVQHVQDLVDAINNMVLKDKSFNIKPVYQGTNPNDPGNGGGWQGGYNDPQYGGGEDHDGDPYTYAALGARFWTRGKTRIIAGENGEPERVTVETKSQVMNGGGAEGGGGPQQIVIPISIGGQQLDEIIMRRVSGRYIRVA